MQANEFIANLKADGSAKDLCDLDKVFQDYKAISSSLAAKDRGPFSLNVLCILCRNLEKVPTWRSRVDSKALVTLSLACVTGTRSLERPERVKTLACVYHIHKHVVRQNTPAPPELVLKLSYMPFESDTDSLLKEYCKTYWNILADRLAYIEKLKTGKLAIIKLLPKLTDDILKVIKIYDSLQFCTNILTFLVKKLNFFYNDNYSVDLNNVFGKIFESLSTKTDLKSFKELTDKELIDLYVKFNDCIYVVAENASKIHFKDSILNVAVRACMSLLGHCTEIFHCFQTFCLNSFCSILTENPNSMFTENILNCLLISCETTEKLGYQKAMIATYPFINQLLRLYMEYSVTNSTKNKWRDYFTEQIQECCLKLMLLLMKSLWKSEQLLKCENCNVKTGLHDALRLSFSIKQFVSVSLSQEIDLKRILPLYYTVIKEQQRILTNLCNLGCSNYEKYYRKLQSDVHNTAILLNKASHFEYSIKLFDIYLRNEICHFKSEIELKNISRALYNKSICELDFKRHENALKDAYLSLVFAQPEGLSTEKYMSLVMDIKAKVLKTKSSDDLQDDENLDELQMMSVLEACKISIDSNNYGNLKPFFCNLKFSVLLKHEFSMYVKLWPSIIPIAGVWKSLYDMSKGSSFPWLKAKDDEILKTLHEVILETPTAVRTIHSEYYTNIVEGLLNDLQDAVDAPELKVVYATLLFLKAEYDLADAGQKYGWKTTEPSMDPDLMPASRTLPAEHAAVKGAVLAVRVWTDIARELTASPPTWLRSALQTAQVFVQQLLHLCRPAHALQLAHACCLAAQHLGDDEAYVRNAGVILLHATKSNGRVVDLVTRAGRKCVALAKNRDTLEPALIFICDCAIHYSACARAGAAARLARAASARILETYAKHPDINLDMATGRLLEALTSLGHETGPSTLTAVNGAQRRYLTVVNTATKWTSRRLAALTLKQRMSWCGARAARLARRLGAWRRARAAAAAALPPAAACAQADLFATITNAHLTDDAQTKIDNRLKHILGLQPSNDVQNYCNETELKNQQLFTPKQDVETMLENMTLKKSQISPSVPCLSVPGFKMPEFLKHERYCTCYACETPYCIILACQTVGLEASMYYRAKEFDIAKNYFEGALKTFNKVDAKLRFYIKNLRDTYEEYILDIVQELYDMENKRVQIEILIEASSFELSQGNYKGADDHVVRIHEIIQDGRQVDQYLSNEILNLMTASAELRKTVKRSQDTGLEAEMEMLKLSPPKTEEAPKTPEAKPVRPPKITKILVNDEEVPNTKRRVIKLNLDEDDEKTPVTKRTSKRTVFKIPVPVTTKPVLETLTPRPSRSKPDTAVQPPEKTNISIFDFATPKPKLDKSKNEFYTPLQTPTEQFFTPMTSVKTYSKKTLHKGIIKNLENEFSTPKNEKSDKENVKMPKTTLEVPTDKNAKTKPVETGSLKTLKDRRTLKRATSPGKLVKEEKKPVVTRSRRLRQPVRFSIDDDKDK